MFDMLFSQLLKWWGWGSNGRQFPWNGIWCTMVVFDAKFELCICEFYLLNVFKCEFGSFIKDFSFKKKKPCIWIEYSLMKWKLIHKQPKFLIWSISVKMVLFFIFLLFLLNLYISCTWFLIIIWKFSVIQYKILDILMAYCCLSFLTTDLCLSRSRSGYMNIFHFNL